MVDQDVGSIRLSTLRDTLETARAHDREGLLESTLDPELVRRIDALSPLTWLPVEDVVELYEGIWRAFGSAKARQINHDAMRDSLKRGLFKNLVKGAERVHGLTPVAVLRYGPKAYTQVTRHCGTQHMTESNDTHAVIRWEAAPAALIRSDAWCDAMKAKYTGQVSFAGRRAIVTTPVRDPERGVVDFRIEWE